MVIWVVLGIVLLLQCLFVLALAKMSAMSEKRWERMQEDFDLHKKDSGYLPDEYVVKNGNNEVLGEGELQKILNK